MLTTARRLHTPADPRPPLDLSAAGCLPAVPGRPGPEHGAMTTYDLRLATLGDVPAITGLIDRAAQWLRTKDTDQWARPWPDRDARDKRVTQGVTRGDTWMLETSGAPAGTVTYRKEGNEILWRPGELSEPAVYVSRLIIDRAFSGRGIGGILIDWAGLRGASEWQASSIRIDVWTDNHGLHAY